MVIGRFRFVVIAVAVVIIADFAVLGAQILGAIGTGSTNWRWASPRLCLLRSWLEGACATLSLSSPTLSCAWPSGRPMPWSCRRPRLKSELPAFHCLTRFSGGGPGIPACSTIEASTARLGALARRLGEELEGPSVLARRHGPGRTCGGPGSALRQDCAEEPCNAARRDGQDRHGPLGWRMLGHLRLARRRGRVRREQAAQAGSVAPVRSLTFNARA